ncbi:MAG: hypothetical protein ACRDYD_04925 [Acidimicrobiales bacterium]
MKAYRFPLQTLARVRRLREEQARAELSLSVRARREAEAEVARRRARLAELGSAEVETMSDLRGVLGAERLAGAAVGFAARRQAEASHAERERRDRWSEAAMGVAVLERLDDRYRAAHRREVLANESKVLDELATRAATGVTGR